MATLVVVGSGGPDATFTLTRVEGSGGSALRVQRFSSTRGYLDFHSLPYPCLFLGYLTL